ncbi:MAG: beta-ketoacyl synthase N-terminal-like domain-containing protein [Planctomycetota bacterium]
MVGYGLRFPQSPTPGSFWQVIREGRDTSRDVPAGRWALPPDQALAGSEPVHDRVRSQRGCFIDLPEGDFGDLDEHLVQSLDPSVRLAVIAGVEAARSITSDLDPDRTRVILGQLLLPTDSTSALAESIIGDTIEELILEGRGREDRRPRGTPSCHPLDRYDASLPASALQRALRLRGGASTLDAACASSLYSIAIACQDLSAHRCDAALAGGVSRPDSLFTQMGFSQLHALSPEGKCRPFDDRGQGLLVGEGAGVLLLKRLDDALSAADPVLGVIHGVGLSNDRAGGLLAPSGEGQLRAMMDAYQQAGWSPEDVDYIECHATGTPVGDATELRSLFELWQSRSWRHGQCALGSVKACIGHTLTAAGAAGVIKVLLAMGQGEIPALPDHKTLPAGLSLEDSPFRIPVQPEPWLRRSGAPRRGAVSAFGFGGINAHLLVEEPPHTPVASETVDASVISSQVTAGSPAAVAIIGLGAIAGRHHGSDQVAAALLGLPSKISAQPMPGDFGVPSTQWAVENGLKFPDGESCGRLRASPLAYRIPPRELADLLPQQLALLKVAREAMNNCRLEQLGERGGLFVGLELDPRSSLYHLRWMLPGRVRLWFEELGLEIDPVQLQQWISTLQDEVSPPLDANRVMGSLGSIAASRLARDVGAGGPSHTVSNDEIGAYRALELAIRSLQDGHVDLAMAAAADLGLDILGRTSDAIDGAPARVETAAAVLLQRLEDARRDGNPVIAIVEGIGCASAGVLERQDPHSPSREACRFAALKDAGVTREQIHVICSDEITGENTPEREQDRQEKLLLPPAMARGGCASFMLSLLQAVTSVSRDIIPSPGTTDHPMPWIKPENQPARILVERSGRLGDCGAMVISRAQLAEQSLAQMPAELKPLGEPSWGVIALEADDVLTLLDESRRLQSWIPEHEGSPGQLARQWLRGHPRDESAARAVTIVFGSRQALLEAARSVPTLLDGSALQLSGPLWELHRSSETPLGFSGDVTFLYPGSGSLFPAAGRELFTRYPGSLKSTLEHSGDLYPLLGSPQRWQSSAAIPNDPRDSILTQVSLGCIGTDLLLGCGIIPRRAAGHSLGETTMLFALRAWRDRRGMQQRLQQDDLFTRWLSGEHHAAACAWNLPSGSVARWQVAVINVSEEEVLQAISGSSRLYLLVVNADRETVVGGDPQQMDQVARSNNWTILPLEGVTAVHCDLVDQVASRYRDLHLWPVHEPIAGAILHSSATGEPLPIDPDGVADSLLQQARQRFHFPRLIHSLWQAGGRIFIEPGPGASCSRLTRKALSGLPHRTLALCYRGEDSELSLARILAVCIAERAPANLTAFLGTNPSDETSPEEIEIRDGADQIIVSPLPGLVPGPGSAHRIAKIAAALDPVVTEPAPRPSAPVSMTRSGLLSPVGEKGSIAARLVSARKQRQELTDSTPSGLLGNRALAARATLTATETVEQKAQPPAVLFDRQACLEFARGKVGPVLGALHAPADAFPTRVRLPDEPLMLVDRILTLEGEPLSLGKGRIVTAHDVLPQAWYLDADRIPTAIVVESGQADLFLSGFLGVDLHTRGLSVYRLLDAQIIFHDDLPPAGKTIIYDIHIDEFFRQDKTLLFRFHFEGTVDGKPLISMRDGCAGFFSREELASGRGIVSVPQHQGNVPVAPEDWSPPAGTETRVLDRNQVEALRRGDLVGAFGSRFNNLPISNPLRLPGGKLRLLDRVTLLEPVGGEWGLGKVVADLEIHPDDWFLTCHFSDDPVMPGTLMYECCLHTLRTLLSAWGWIGEEGDVIPMPVPGVAGRLRCRGQVLPTTGRVTYEVEVKEIGFRPEPYVITDAVMLADGRPIVEMQGMSLRLSGLDEQKIDKLWRSRPQVNDLATREPDKIPWKAPGGGGDSPRIASVEPTLYDHDQILEFSVGRPSLAFGNRYLPFDNDRFIARLPGPPYCFLDRIIDVKGVPWEVTPGAACTAEYFSDPDSWYFDAGGTGEMPFAVLLEIALQPCGWLAAYVGSALSQDRPLHFRNLGGEATLVRPVDRRTGLLTTRVELTAADHGAGMWIQHYDIEVRDETGPVYRGNTYFGFFPPEALQQQVGLPGAVARTIPPREANRARAFTMPRWKTGVSEVFRMVEDVEIYVPQGGVAGLGFIQGGIDVDPEAWFFDAHFQGDPVWPGSLGLESMLQLMRVVADDLWTGDGPWIPRTMAPGMPHRWCYRGQVIPGRNRISVEATVKSVDIDRGILVADGMLSVDGLPIYSMEDFSMQRLREDR